MCGRFALTASPRDVQEVFGLADVEDFPPRYNIAPTQPILVVAAAPGGGFGSNLPRRRALLVRWGLLPAWVDDVKAFPLLINGRAETAADKPAFRAAMRHRRVLVPANGFYEWRRPPQGKGRAQAYWVRPRQGGIVAFGALVETYMSPDGSEIDTGAILTTPANEELAPIHARMPVVIQPEDFTRWLDCRGQEPRDVADLTAAAAPDFFEAVPVSDKVNAVANTGPELQNAVDEAPPASGDDSAPDAPPKQYSLF